MESQFQEKQNLVCIEYPYLSAICAYGCCSLRAEERLLASTELSELNDLSETLVYSPSGNDTKELIQTLIGTTYAGRSPTKEIFRVLYYYSIGVFQKDFTITNTNDEVRKHIQSLGLLSTWLDRKIAKWRGQTILKPTDITLSDLLYLKNAYADNSLAHMVLKSIINYLQDPEVGLCSLNYFNLELEYCGEYVSDFLSKEYVNDQDIVYIPSVDEVSNSLKLFRGEEFEYDGVDNYLFRMLYYYSVQLVSESGSLLRELPEYTWIDIYAFLANTAAGLRHRKGESEIDEVTLATLHTLKDSFGKETRTYVLLSSIIAFLTSKHPRSNPPDFFNLKDTISYQGE